MVSPTKEDASSKTGKEHIFFKFMHSLLLSLYILLSSIYTYRCVWGDAVCVFVCLRTPACVYVYNGYAMVITQLDTKLII